MPTKELGAALSALHRATGQDYSGATFESRLRIQKTIYFLKAFRYEPALGYSFGDYFHGPYSPVLANEYYELRKVPSTAATFGRALDFPKGAMKFLQEATKAGNDTLEAAATLHAFLTRNRTSSETDAIAHLGQVKGWLADRGREALRLLKRFDLVPGAI